MNHCRCCILEIDELPNRNGPRFCLSLKLNTFSLHKKIKFSVKNFFSKCNQIRNFLWIWSHLLKKSLMQNFIFCAVPLKGYFLPCPSCGTKFHIISTFTTVLSFVSKPQSQQLLMLLGNFKLIKDGIFSKL